MNKLNVIGVDLATNVIQVWFFDGAEWRGSSQRQHLEASCVRQGSCPYEIKISFSASSFADV